MGNDFPRGPIGLLLWAGVSYEDVEKLPIANPLMWAQIISDPAWLRVSCRRHYRNSTRVEFHEWVWEIERRHGRKRAPAPR